MDPQDMADLIKAQLILAFGPPTDPAILDGFLLALCTGIITHIQNAAKVNPGTFANGGGPLAGQGTIV